jgi:hypothetical protein
MMPVEAMKKISKSIRITSEILFMAGQGMPLLERTSLCDFAMLGAKSASKPLGKPWLCHLLVWICPHLKNISGPVCYNHIETQSKEVI